jgi:GNAT superfamily N-acetyltransferase
MITIRQATIGDIEALQHLDQELFVDSVAYDPDLELDWALSDKGKAHFEKYIRASDCACFVAEDVGKCIGYITLVPKIVVYRKSRCIEIRDMAVTAAYQSKGIGSLLVQKAVEWAKGKGYQKIYVSCYAQNTRARSFYQQNGLKEIDLGLEKDL